MKRIAAVIVAGIISVSMTSVVFAAPGDLKLSDSEILSIKAGCVSAKQQLTQVRAADALVRVNAGRQYEVISTKLMAPLNSRISLNRLDSTKLVRLTIEYDQAAEQFRNIYQQYKKDLSKAIATDCTVQPVAFHDALVTARDRRGILIDTMKQIKKLLNEYRTEFTNFSKNTLEGKNNG